MSQTTLVVIADPGHEYLDELARLPPDVRVIVSKQQEELQKECLEADVILYVGNPEILRSVFPRAGNLRWLHSLNAGVEHILFPELVKSPVIVTNARGVYKHALTEFVMAGVLFFVKDMARLSRQQASAKWQPFDAQEARGKVMGIVGYGETGRACAELARAFGMRVLGLRRRPELSSGDPLLERVFGLGQLQEMLPSCDFIVLSAPGTPQTKHLIGQTEINMMSSHAVVINVGRGSLIDEAALIEALQQGKLFGAALDVFEIEPLPPSSPLYRMTNVLLSPHCTDHVLGWRENGMRDFIENFYRFLKGEPLRNVVDKIAGY